MSVMICGTARGTTKRYRCVCCGFESDSIEPFAMATCWACVGGNPECATCVSEGVPFDRFSSKRGKLHRLLGLAEDWSSLVSACGFTVAREDVGQATAVRDWCKHCWPGARAA